MKKFRLVYVKNDLKTINHMNVFDNNEMRGITFLPHPVVFFYLI